MKIDCGKISPEKNSTYIPQEKEHKVMIYLLKGKIQIDACEVQTGDTLFIEDTDKSGFM